MSVVFRKLNGSAAPAPVARRELPSWLPLAFAVVALVYLFIAVMQATRGDPARATCAGTFGAMTLPFHLFLVAIAPACAGLVLLWAEHAMVDLRIRRLVRAAALLVASVAVLTLAGGNPV